METLTLRIIKLLFCVTVVAATGCSHWNELNRKEQGAVIGAGSGALIGAAVGGVIGTVIGGVGGGLAGGVIGSETKRR